MSNTVEVPLPVGEWVKLISGPAKGYISNESSVNFIIKEDDDAALNDSILGHTVSSRDEIGFTYDIKNNQAIYAYAASAASKATHTPFS